MELAVIRVKRSRETEAPAEIGLGAGRDVMGLASGEGAKRMKLDTATVPIVTTVDCKDAAWPQLLRDAVSKLRSDKARKLVVDHRELHKSRPAPRTKVSGEKAKLDRYKIVSQSRGITHLDAATGNYLAKSDRIAVKDSCQPAANASSCQATVSSDSKEAGAGSSTSQAENLLDKTNSVATTASNSDGLDQLNFQVFDVDHISAEKTEQTEERVSMNGVPLEKTYVYDIFLAMLPSGASLDYVSDTTAWETQLYDQPGDRPASDYDSDDSNCEDYYTNDYPEGEKITAMFSKKAQAAFEDEDEQKLFDQFTGMSLGDKEEESASDTDESESMLPPDCHIDGDDPWICEDGEWGFRDAYDSSSGSSGSNSSNSDESSSSSSDEDDMDE